MSDSRKILIGVVTCHANDGRRLGIQKTWRKKIPTGVEFRFFYGRGEKEEHYDDVILDCDDSYQGLPAKIKAMCQWALDHGFEWLFRVDDDTRVNLKKLLEEKLVDDYIGRRNSLWGGFASGGPGFWLSRRAMERIAKQPLSNDPADDRWVGQVLAAYGIDCVHSDMYVLDTTRFRLREVATICRVMGAPVQATPPDPDPIEILE